MVSVPLSTTIALGGALALLAVVLSVRHISLHLRHFTNPSFQLHIVRILAMVPIYSLTSWAALIARRETTVLVLELARDSYEAYVIYNFFVLLIKFAGGHLPLCRYLEAQPRLPHPFPLRLWLPPVQPGPAFLNAIRIAVLQFVFVKPAGSLLKLHIFLHRASSAHPLSSIALAVLNNLSVSCALYGLVTFYHAAHHLLLPFHPFAKFLAVKAVVFFSFWQGAVLSLAVYAGVLTDVDGFSAHEQATGLQDLLICFEMAVAAVAHYFVFSYHEYELVDSYHLPTPMSATKQPLLHVVDFRDVLSDAKDRICGGVGFGSELRDEEHLLLDTAGIGENSRTGPQYSRPKDVRPHSISADLMSSPWLLPESPPPKRPKSTTQP